MRDRGARFRLGAPLLISLLLLALGGPALRQYNVSWDEALGDFFFGQRYWSYFTTLDPVYLDFARDPYPNGFVPDLSSSLMRDRPSHFYGVGGTLAAGTSALLHGRLGWLDPYDGYHAVNLWLSVVLVFALHGWLLRNFGPLVAALGPCLLLLCPRVAFHAMANIKDYPAMVFFALALLAFEPAYRAASVAGVLGSGVLFGLAIGAKSNGLFVAPVVGLHFLLTPLPPAWRDRGRALLAVAGAGVLGVGTLVAVWPYTWEAPARLLFEHLHFLATRAQSVRPESVAPFLSNVLYTTPIPFLALFVVGLWPLAERLARRDPAALLLALWITVVAGRYALPGAVNFDGVRHFLELFPPMAAVGALGAAWLAARARRLRVAGLGRALQAAVVVLPLVSMGWSLVRSHPFEIAYWNAWVGGLAGAQERHLAQAGDYWGASYRLGLAWLNEHAERDSALAVPLIEHAVRLVAPERLRADLTLLSLDPAKGPAALAQLRREAERRDVYVMFVPRRDWMNAVMRHFLGREEPVRAWEHDGAPVLLIYRVR